MPWVKCSRTGGASGTLAGAREEAPLLPRDVVAGGSCRLLAESAQTKAQIAPVELPRLTAPLRRPARRWDEERLLDPGAADRTISKIATELGDVEARARPLAVRQRQIAVRLRALLSD